MSGVSLKKVSYSYGNFSVLADVNMRIPKGQFVSIVGAFGSGKSTLLKIIAGLLTDYGGEVLVNGNLPKEELATRNIGFASQRPTLLPWRDVLDNLHLPLELVGRPDYARCEKLLNLIGLERIARQHINELSGGMRQIVSILRSLALEPEILLLDEPFSSVDELSRDFLHSQLAAIHAQTKKTTVMITHSLQDAVYLSDAVYVLGGQPTTVVHKKHISLPKDRQNLDKYDSRIIEHVGTLRYHLGAEHDAIYS